MSTIIKASIAAAFTMVSAYGVAAQTGGTTSGQKMSQAECQTMWNTADSSKSGSLTQTQAQTYVTDFKVADTNNDGRLSSTEFLAACQQGHVRGSASSGTGSGTTGTGK